MNGDLDQLARSFVQGAEPFAFCGIGVSDPQGEVFSTATAGGIIANEHSMFRAASISKIVTGRVAERALWAAGKTYATVEDILGFAFRAPDGSAPTPAHLASHQAGITDAAGYIIPDGMSLSEWIETKGGAIWSGASVGAQFEYSNLGFVILAACAERAAGERFDDLANRKVLQSRGISGAFNWSRITGNPHILAIYRRLPDGRFVAQIDDGPLVQPDLPDPYAAGTRPSVFSPQGGLRISLVHLMSLGRLLRDHPTTDGWLADPARTLGPADLFQSYAWGVQILPDPSFYPRPLIGHFANAYGFCGGVWWDAARNRVFAYALNGLAMGDEDDGLRPQERAIFEAVSQLA